MFFIVLGMHKSGTTLISKVLNESGIAMVSDVNAELDYDQGNHYERQSAVAINDHLLKGCMLPPLLHLKSKHYHSLSIPLRLPNHIGSTTQNRINRMIEKLKVLHNDFGFKDPRTCLTYHLWQPSLPEHKVVGIYRDYREIINHYHRNLINKCNFIRLYRLLYVWTSYNLRLVEHFKVKKQNQIFINYETLMSDNSGEFQRLQAFIGKKLIDLRDPTKRRNRNTNIPPFLNTILPYLMKLLPTHPTLLIKKLNMLRNS